MSDTAPNAIEKSLEAARADAKKAQDQLSAFRRTIAERIGLSPDASVDEVATHLGGRLDDIDGQVTAKTATLTAERDAARADADKIKADRAAERVDSAISAALAKSAMIQANTPDAMNLLRPLFHVDDKGNVTTRGGDTGEPAGVTPEQFVAARLGALRSHWFPGSVSGGARGGGAGTNPLGDTSMFDPRSPKFSVTKQFAYEHQFGAAAADAARRRYSGGGR